MEIIFHGKPNTNSIYATEANNSLLQKRITDSFFEARGGIPNDKALVVETYFWQEKWYSVYTFSFAKLKGNEDRPESYFSISLIFQDVYLSLTSAVYLFLDKVYKDFIQDKIISTAGKYIVKDFDNKSHFDSIVSYIRKDFTNLPIPLTKDFVTTKSNKNIRYNLVDCDALTFIGDLQKNGRIVVGVGADFPQKCDASVLVGKDNQIKQLSDNNAKQEEQIKTLNAKLTDAQQAANNSASSVKSQLQKLESNVKLLEEKNEQVKKQLSDKQNEFNELVDKIRTLLPNTKTEKQVQVGNPTDEEVSLKKYLRFLPLANFVLIAVCICLLLIGKWNPISHDDALKKLQDKVTQLENENREKDKIIENLQTTIEQQEQTITPLTVQQNNKESQPAKDVATTVQSTTGDIDCKVDIWKSDLEPIKNNSEINNGEKLIIQWTPHEGYAWYAWNLSEASQKKLKNAATGKVIVPIEYVKSANDSKSEVIITYRTSNRDNLCPNNKITLKIKQQ